jgi:hypothetical protein
MQGFDYWPVVNTVLGVGTLAVSGLLALIVRTVAASLRDLATADTELWKEISSIKEIIAGGYIKRDEADRRRTEMNDRIENVESRVRDLEKQ